MKRIHVVLAVAAVAVSAAGCHDRRPRDLDGKRVPTPGSYALTCRNVAEMPGGMISADCLDTHGQFQNSAIKRSSCPVDIGNINGKLTCVNPAAPPPVVASSAPAASDAAPARP